MGSLGLDFRLIKLSNVGFNWPRFDTINRIT
jgi:hypothetical protein